MRVTRMMSEIGKWVVSVLIVVIAVAGLPLWLILAILYWAIVQPVMAVHYVIWDRK